VPLGPAYQPVPPPGIVAAAHRSVPHTALPRSLALPPAPSHCHWALASSCPVCQPLVPASSCPTVLPCHNQTRIAREACAVRRCRSSPEPPCLCRASPRRRTLPPSSLLPLPPCNTELTPTPSFSLAAQHTERFQKLRAARPWLGRGLAGWSAGCAWQATEPCTVAPGQIRPSTVRLFSIVFQLISFTENSANFQNS
jgi:hypothetical protein